MLKTESFGSFEFGFLELVWNWVLGAWEFHQQWFMGSPHSILCMHWDDEPVNAPHPSFGHPLPILVQRSGAKDGEREG